MKRRKVAILSTIGALTILVGGSTVGASVFLQSQEDAQVTNNNINRMMEYNDKLYAAYKNVKHELSDTKEALSNLTNSNNEVKAQLDQTEDATHKLRLKTDNEAIPKFASQQPDANDVTGTTSNTK